MYMIMASSASLHFTGLNIHPAEENSTDQHQNQPQNRTYAGLTGDQSLTRPAYVVFWCWSMLFLFFQQGIHMWMWEICGRSRNGAVLTSHFQVTLHLNVTEVHGLGARGKRDANTTRECVSHLLEKGNGRHCQDIWPTSSCAEGEVRHWRATECSSNRLEQDRREGIGAF